MTRGEARIKLIEIRAQLEVILSMYGLEISDVFDIAIEALSAEPCEDCISRKAHWQNNACSNCGIYNASAYKNWCPNCGAKMESEE